MAQNSWTFVSSFIFLIFVLHWSQFGTATPLLQEAGAEGEKAAVALQIHDIVRRAGSGKDFSKKTNNKDVEGGNSALPLKCIESFSAPWMAVDGVGGSIETPEGAVENPAICLTVTLKIRLEGSTEELTATSRFGAPADSPAMKKIGAKNEGNDECLPTEKNGSPLYISVNSATFQAETTQVCGCRGDFCNKDN